MAECLAVGLNQPKKLEAAREEIPDADHAEVVVDIVVPVVVDVEAVVVEVADTDEVVISGLQILLILIIFHRKLSFNVVLYALFPEFYSGAAGVAPPPRTSKKFNLYLFPHPIAILEYAIFRRIKQDISHGQAVAEPVVAR